MATTKINAIIIEASRRLKDARSDASAAGDTGKRYSSAILARYANKGVREFLVEKYVQLGEKFGDVLPEYMKTSGALTLVGGVVAKPTDAFIVMDLDKSDYALRFAKLSQDEVQVVRGGGNKIVVPSVAKPVFWDELSSIFVLPAGVGAYDVIARYIRTHVDIVPVTAPVGAGNWNTAAGQYTVATRQLNAAMSVSYVTGDVGKRVMFRTAGTSFEGIIENRVSASVVALRAGDNLPGVDIGAGLVLQVIVSDKADGADLTLNEYWHGEIVDRVVAMGRDDAQSGVVR